MDGSASEIWLDEPLHSDVCHAHTKSAESFKDVTEIDHILFTKVLHIPLHLYVCLLNIVDAFW